MEIIWTEEALSNYLNVIDYLYENWSTKEIQKLETDTNALLERIMANPEICPKSKLLNFRKCLIDNQNSLIYQFINNKILIITFIDNRSSHIY